MAKTTRQPKHPHKVKQRARYHLSLYVNHSPPAHIGFTETTLLAKWLSCALRSVQLIAPEQRVYLRWEISGPVAIIEIIPFPLFHCLYLIVSLSVRNCFVAIDVRELRGWCGLQSMNSFSTRVNLQCRVRVQIRYTSTSYIYEFQTNPVIC